MSKILTVTESAEKYLSDLFLTQQKQALRISLMGGGCSGLTIKFDFGQPEEKDHKILIKNGAILIDQRTALFIQGAILNFKNELNNYGLKLENLPGAKRTCGCGDSFSF